MNDFLLDRPIFETRKGRELHYIDHDDKHIRCWLVKRQTQTAADCSIGLIPFARISQEELERLEVWKDVNPVTQSIVQRIDKNGQKAYEQELVKEAADNAEKEVRRIAKKNGEEPPKPRRTRRSLDKFKDYPEFLECKCGNKTKANYSYLSKKAEDQGVEVMELVNGYVCQECNPTKGRGRKPNPEYADLPEFLECKCGNKTKANYTYLTRKADKLAVTLQHIVDTYQCQSCNPSKGRPKKK